MIELGGAGAFDGRGMGWRIPQQRALTRLVAGEWRALIPAAIAAGCRNIALPALNGWQSNEGRVRPVGLVGQGGRLGDRGFGINRD